MVYNLFISFRKIKYTISILGKREMGAFKLLLRIHPSFVVRIIIWYFFRISTKKIALGSCIRALYYVTNYCLVVIVIHTSRYIFVYKWCHQTGLKPFTFSTFYYYFFFLSLLFDNISDLSFQYIYIKKLNLNFLRVSVLFKYLCIIMKYSML